MGRFDDEFVAQMDDVDRLIERTEDPLHRRILINFRRHGLLEVSGRYDELLAPEMTVEHPVYRLFEDGEAILLDGMDQVRGFYQSLAEIDMLVMWIKDAKIAVGDWGFAGEVLFSQFIPGRMMSGKVFSNVAAGGDLTESEVFDADAWYLVRRTLCFNWPYDAAGRMIGEHVYEDSLSRTVERVDEADVIDGARAIELLTPVIDRYGLPPLIDA
ncbi:hypothetical protein JOD62_000413 [Microbacterium keratanolyticum]|uniref:Uncharacterized protein n=1 Tax=Microbacterium keratanolyticum TaxID=67574 RepID=A0A9W6MA13_9MICO|nr:hypothetical protein [Microbacterium keratanolyticum]MBM7467865.1 hypothetical protein [Microbacterium keratanolyticum]GLK02856.1 hypothetical protein GCM10017596_25710 [Microbacterium keratanolyticum]